MDDLKALLSTISQVHNANMMMEFRISDVMEKFRTLKMYN